MDVDAKRLHGRSPFSALMPKTLVFPTGTVSQLETDRLISSGTSAGAPLPPDTCEELDLLATYKDSQHQFFGLKGALYTAKRHAADTDTWMIWTALSTRARPSAGSARREKT
jgi:hypothetical protein